MPTTSPPLELLCPGELIGNGTLSRHTLPPGTLQIDVPAQSALHMAALLVLEQRLLQVDVSLGDEHGHHPLVLYVGVPVKVRSDGLPGLRQLHVEIVHDQHPGQFSTIGIMIVKREMSTHDTKQQASYYATNANVWPSLNKSSCSLFRSAWKDTPGINHVNTHLLTLRYSWVTGLPTGAARDLWASFRKLIVPWASLVAENG